MKDFTKLPETTLKAIGEKHEPYSIRESAEKANPNYSKKKESYSMNCQRCVVTYELLRRGYNVQAKTYKGSRDMLPYNWDRVFSSRDVCPVGNLRELSQWTRVNSTNKSGRYILQINWKNGGGHVFCLELKNNRLYSIDPQVNRMGVLKEYLSMKDEDGYMLIYRTDETKLNRRVWSMVKRGTKDYE
jgi:hypothetical protein